MVFRTENFVIGVVTLTCALWRALSRFWLASAVVLIFFSACAPRPPPPRALPHSILYHTLWSDAMRRLLAFYVSLSRGPFFSFPARHVPMFLLRRCALVALACALACK